jgi:hypothetical protein
MNSLVHFVDKHDPAILSSFAVLRRLRMTGLLLLHLLLPSAFCLLPFPSPPRILERSTGDSLHTPAFPVVSLFAP